MSETLAGQIEELSRHGRHGRRRTRARHQSARSGERRDGGFPLRLGALLEALPSDLPLGLYECPAPYRRLLSDEEFRICLDTRRFTMMKDVSCDLATVKRRLAMAKGSNFALINASAAIAAPAMRAGSPGFSGVSTNLHPDLYAWLYRSDESELWRELASFLVTAAFSEAFGYPALAKICHQRLGTLKSIRCRVIDFDVRERFWALDAIVDAIMAGIGRLSRQDRGRAAEGESYGVRRAPRRRLRLLTSCSP